MEGRLNLIESLLSRIEERLALWREAQQARELEAEADRTDCGRSSRARKTSGRDHRG